MKQIIILLILVLILAAIITCNVAITAMSPRAEGVANHAIDSYFAYQREPGVVLERQMESIQANSPSNADEFPIALVFMLVGLGLLLFARYYEDILNARTEYLKAKKRNQPKLSAPAKPIQVIDPWAHLRPPAQRPALPAAAPSPDEASDERW